MGIYGLQLRKGGNLFAIDWDAEREDYVEKVVSSDDYVFFTNEYVCLDRNISLKDFFLLLNKHMEYFSVISAYPYLNELISEGLAEPSDPCEEINFLELRRVAVLQGDNIPSEGPLGEEYLFKTFDFCGISSDDRYGLELMPLNTIISFPLFINEMIEIQDGEEGKILFKYNEKFTLYELVNGIIEELAYAGSVDDREFLREKIKKAVKEAEMEGEAKLISFDDLKKELDEKADENKLPCKYCGKESRSPHFNKPERVCFSCFKNSREN
jgi:hypothetical protein